jgi:glycosyltransferase involved in cell wall biosynthesis
MMTPQPNSEGDLRPRVLMVGPWPPTKGGVTTFMLNVVRSRLRERYEFIPFTTSRPAKRNVSADNYGYAAVFKGGLKRVLQGIAITAWHVAKYPWIVMKQQPSVIQVQASDFQAFWEAASYVMMAKALRRPVVMRIGGSFDRFYEASGRHTQKAIRAVLRRPAAVIVQSEYWRQYVSRLIPSANIVILTNFVPEALIRPRGTTDARPLRFTLCSGEVPRLKGVYVLLKALENLKADGICAEVTIMAVTEPLRRYIVRKGMERDVRMLDFLSHEDALQLLRETDVFLQISGSEGFPNALLEAMASGCASIVTPVGAVPEIVGPDGECAFVIPVGGSTELSQHMRRLIEDPALTARMGAAAQRRVAASYTTDCVVPTLDRIWQLAMRNRMSLITGAHRQDLT